MNGSQKALLIMWLFLTACQGKTGKPVDPDDLRFTTTQGSELFFRNVRLPYYEELPGYNNKHSGYLLDKADKTNSTIILEPVLIIDWKKSQAWLDLQFMNDPGMPDPVTIRWEDPTTGNEGFIRFSHLTRNKTIEAVKIYNHLITGGSFYIIEGGNLYPVLITDDQRTTFRRTVVDFLRLTGVL